MVRALTSPQCDPGSISRPNIMWVQFVVGSRPCSEGFPPVFLPPQKSTLLNSDMIKEQRIKSHSVEMPLLIPIFFFWINLLPYTFLSASQKQIKKVNGFTCSVCYRI